MENFDYEIGISEKELFENGFIETETPLIEQEYFEDENQYF